MKIALVIFTKNERENLEAIFFRIPFKLVDIVYAVDGNSTDGTREFFGKKKIKVFDQKYKGIGGAFESAFRNIKADALVIFHPDGNMNPNDIKEFVRRLKAGEEFIVATRMIKGARNEEDDELLKPRKWFNQALALLTTVLWGRNGNKCTDIVQGYRAIRTDTYKALKIIKPDPIGPEYEQVIRALKRGIRITEFPTIEKPRVHGETTMPSFKTGWGNIKVFLREFVSS